MDGKIGVPSVAGMTGALKNAGIGVVGGAIVGLSQKFFGTGIWGSIAGIVAAGSILKGSSGEIIATVLGYDIGKQIVAGGLGGLLSSGGSSSTASSGYTVI